MHADGDRKLSAPPEKPAYSGTPKRSDSAHPAPMQLYYITDRRQFPGNDAAQRRQLLQTIGAAADAAVDFIQLRERDLPVREFETLAREALAAVRSANRKTRLLINSRTDVALGVGADGVHLRSDDPFASEARAMAAARRDFVVAVSCHTSDDVLSAWSHGANFAVFGPVFEKQGARVTLVEGLRTVCAKAPGFVFALGGVNETNAAVCRDAGAAGVAGIRLFQQAGDLAVLLRQLRR
jgi:thiamine-phosphate pyrophosphorylase